MEPLSDFGESFHYLVYGRSFFGVDANHVVDELPHKSEICIFLYGLSQLGPGQRKNTYV